MKLIATGLLFMAVAVWLPLVVKPAVATPVSFRLIPPSGIECFWTDGSSRRDSTGALFVNCQAKNGRGQVVWRQDDAGSVLVLESGYSGRGSLDADADGLWLTTADPNASEGIRMAVPGWQP